MSGVISVKLRSVWAGTNAGAGNISLRTLSSSRCTGPASAWARGVGFISVPLRTNNGSSSSRRSRAQRRLAQAQRLRRTGHAALLGHRAQHHQQVQIHLG